MATKSSSGRRRGLGKGLGSLIRPDAPAPGGAAPATYFECELERIVPNPDQPRRRFDEGGIDALAASLKESGVIQPLVVRRGDDDTYPLIAGERRWRAAQRAGLKTVPVVVRETTEDEVFALALVENVQRRDLDPIEEARAIEHLIDEHDATHDEVATLIGRSRSAVTNLLRLLRLPDSLRVLVADGDLSAGHARAILVVDADQQAPLAERILTDGLNVRQAEALAKQVAAGQVDLLTPKAAPKKPAEPELRPQLRVVVNDLQSQLGAKVKLVQKKPGGSGRLEIHFADDRALQAIVDAIQGD